MERVIFTVGQKIKIEKNWDYLVFKHLDLVGPKRPDINELHPVVLTLRGETDEIQRCS